MSYAFAKLAALQADRRGIAAMEYGLIAAFVALAIIGGASAFGGDISAFFRDLGNNFDGKGTITLPSPTTN